MPLPPASGGAGPSGRQLAAAPAATSPAFPRPRIAMRAPRRVMWKRPPKRGRLTAGSNKFEHCPSGPGDSAALGSLREQRPDHAR
jgi:hypothetical protein